MAEPLVTILCVDDEPIPRNLRKLILLKQGYKVVDVATGAKALEMLEDGGVGLVLSDQMMPGMSGTQLAKQVRSRWPHLPFLLISGMNEIPAGAEYADGFVSKVAGPQALFDSIKDLLTRYAGREPATERMPGSMHPGSSAMESVSTMFQTAE